MNLEGLDNRRRNSRSRRLSSSSIMSEEDKTNTGFIESLVSEGFIPPPTAVIRKSETRCIKTNQTTGIKIVDQCAKNLSMIASVRQQLVNQKECMKMGSSRPITSRGQRDLNFHGNRHFQGVLHSKIKELTLETEKLHWKCKDAQQEYINSLTYETKAKELASEITKFQKNLADLNLTFDYVNRIGDIEKIEQEVRQLEELNRSEKGRIEGLFEERKLKEDFVHQIENNEHVKKVNNSSYPGTAKENEQFIYLNDRLSQSEMAVKFWKKQIEQYKKVKDALTQKLKTKLPFMDDIIALEIKLLNLKGKSYEVNDNSILAINKEREQLLEAVKLDKSEITKMDFNLKSLSNKIDNLNQVLDYLNLSETDIPNTKEKIYFYLSSFDNKKDNETEKLDLLKSEIMEYLSDLQIKMSLIPTMIDYLNLNENKIGGAEMSDSIDTFQEYRIAFNSLKKLELMKLHLTKDCNYIEEKFNKLKDDLEEYNSQRKMNEKFETQENKLKKQILQLEESKTIHLSELDKAKSHLEKLEKDILENEKHKELLALEEKYSSQENDIMLMNQTINEMKTTTTHLLEIRTKSLNLMGLINSGLINHYEQDRSLSICASKNLFK